MSAGKCYFYIKIETQKFLSVHYMKQSNVIYFIFNVIFYFTIGNAFCYGSDNVFIENIFKFIFLNNDQMTSENDSIFTYNNIERTVDVGYYLLEQENNFTFYTGENIVAKHSNGKYLSMRVIDHFIGTDSIVIIELQKGKEPLFHEITIVVREAPQNQRTNQPLNNLDDYFSFLSNNNISLSERITKKNECIRRFFESSNSNVIIFDTLTNNQYSRTIDNYLSTYLISGNRIGYYRTNPGNYGKIVELQVFK